MANVIKAVKLFFQEGTSDKVYNATLVEEGGVYTVQVEWGRRGAPLNRGNKAVKTTLAVAEKEYAKVLREKTGKGYEEMTEKVVPASVAPPVGSGSASKVGGVGRKKLGQAAQLLNAVDDDKLEALLADDRYVAQQKLDGSRVLIHVGSEIVGTNRAGQVMAGALDRKILKVLEEVPRGSVLDGELVGAIYWVFDLLSHGEADLRADPYTIRHEILGDMFDDARAAVRVVESAATAAEKRKLLDKLSRAKAEGIVFKKRDAPYKAGRPASGGTQLKYKFIKTADVFLTANVGNAYQMAVFDGKKVRDVGKVFAGTTNEIRAQLDELISSGERPVAEVKYLYATDGDILFQPVFAQLRDDKEPSDCLLSQLVHTNRDVS